MIEFGVVHGNAKDVADRSIIMSQLCEKVVNSLG